MDAKHYEKMTVKKPGTEWPDDPKPTTATAIRARRDAINEGRLIAPPRDEAPRTKTQQKVADSDAESYAAADAENIKRKENQVAKTPALNDEEGAKNDPEK